VLKDREHSSGRAQLAFVVRIALTGIALAVLAVALMPGAAGAASVSVGTASRRTSDASCISLTTCYSARQLELADALIWTLAIIVVFGTLAVARYRRG
jgi:hypothetical protein